MNWQKIGWGILIADLLAINIFGIWHLTFNKINSIQVPVIANTSNTEEIGDLKARIIALENKKVMVATPAATPAITPVVVEKTTTIVKTAPKTKIKSTQYVTIPGTGTTTGLDWTNLAGTEFYFDIADYPGLLEVYFEAGVNLFNGNGKAYARLFDATNGIGVQGSNMETSSQANNVISSGKVSFWRGRNLIRVQAKTLTSDTTVYSWGRLRIITEN